MEGNLGGRTTIIAGWIALLAVLGLGAQVPGAAQERVATISILVRDPAGGPVSGVEVLVSGADWHEGTTDAAGQVRLRVVPGVWEVAPSHSEFAVLPTDQSVLVRSGGISALEFRALPKTGAVRGRVVFRSLLPAALTGPLTDGAYPATRDGGSLPVAATRRWHLEQKTVSGSRPRGMRSRRATAAVAMDEGLGTVALIGAAIREGGGRT